MNVKHPGKLFHFWEKGKTSQIWMMTQTPGSEFEHVVQNVQTNRWHNPKKQEQSFIVQWATQVNQQFQAQLCT